MYWEQNAWERTKSAGSLFFNEIIVLKYQFLVFTQER